MSKKINVSFDNIYRLDSAIKLDDNFAWHFKNSSQLYQNFPMSGKVRVFSLRAGFQ